MDRDQEVPVGTSVRVHPRLGKRPIVTVDRFCIIRVDALLKNRTPGAHGTIKRHLRAGEVPVHVVEHSHGRAVYFADEFDPVTIVDVAIVE